MFSAKDIEDALQGIGIDDASVSLVGIQEIEICTVYRGPLLDNIVAQIPANVKVHLTTPGN